MTPEFELDKDYPKEAYDADTDDAENTEYKMYQIDLADVSSFDLQKEIADNPDITDWQAFSFYEYDDQEYEKSVSGTCLYSKTIGRAGIEYGADAAWTDCDDEDDAMDRYFENDGKEMQN